MTELDRVTALHLARYPKMQKQDKEKLAFQYSFGPGHLVTDEQESLRRLTDEYQPEKIELSIPIGNRLCRINIGAVAPRFLVLLNKMFVHTANTFLPEERKTTKSIPRHSPVYREAYVPRYRVVYAGYARYFALFCAIDDLLRNRERVCLAIDGMCASGKSTLAGLIGGVFDCNIIRMDDFFLPPALRGEERYAQIGGNLHYERVTQEVILPLTRGEAVAYRVFDCGKMTDTKTIRLARKRLYVLEGTYSMREEFCPLYDLKIALRIDPALQRARIEERNGRKMLERFQTLWIPLENRYFEQTNLWRRADYLYQ